ncbi:MAG: hypothetical protein RIM84_01730 [Alphaproteobacteria bacterium]
MNDDVQGGGHWPPPLFFVCLCLLATLWLSPARAGWAYTEWGMSQDDVLAAANGKVTHFYEPHPEPWGLYPDLIGDHRDLRHTYEVEFYFDDETGGLVGVRLAPYGRYWCMDLMQSLIRTFGNRNMMRRGGILEFADAANNNLISHRFEPCAVRYQPLDPQAAAR